MHHPELRQPVPSAVVGQEQQQVVELRRERVAIVLGRQKPRRRPLVDVEMRHLLGGSWHELGRARSRPDHRHPAARDLYRVVPGGRVKPGALEGVPACESGKRGPVELSRRAHHCVELLARLVPSASGRRGPAARRLVVARLGHLAAEADAIAEPEAPSPSPGGRPGGRVGPRSVRPSRWSARRRSCRAGSARRPGSPGTRSRARCPRRRRSSRTRSPSRPPGGAGAPPPGPRPRPRSPHNGTVPPDVARDATSGAGGPCPASASSSVRNASQRSVRRPRRGIRESAAARHGVSWRSGAPSAAWATSASAARRRASSICSGAEAPAGREQLGLVRR